MCTYCYLCTQVTIFLVYYPIEIKCMYLTMYVMCIILNYKRGCWFEEQSLVNSVEGFVKTFSLCLVTESVFVYCAKSKEL